MVVSFKHTKPEMVKKFFERFMISSEKLPLAIKKNLPNQKS
jgi:hypothetical protein